MSRTKRNAWLLLATSITIHLVISRSGHSPGDTLDDVRSSRYSIGKRSGGDGSIDHRVHQSLLALPYSKWYDDSPEASKPFMVIAILTWLGFLFSFIGITASDFFCPNLSSIASFLGLSETTAGVTFLAFGNGSPDVFSTFAALKGGTFGLAIGELIGAASFIVSIVVGSIAFVRPFHVPRHAFLRDVIFFTAAVILLITVLHDGRLTIWESATMVGLYVCYVIVVISGNWLMKRRKRKEASPHLPFDRRSEENSPHLSHHSPHRGHAPQGSPSLTLRIPEPALPMPNGTPGQVGNIEHSRRSSMSGSSSIITPLEAPQRIRPGRFISGSRLSTFTPGRDGLEVDTPRANFSLLGAVEFRDVINSLRKDSPGGSKAPTPGGVSPLSRLEEENGDYFGARPPYGGHRRATSIAAPRRSRKSSPRSGSRRQRAASHLGTSPFSPPLDHNAPVTAPAAPSEPNPWSEQLGNPPRIPTSSHHSDPSTLPTISVVNPTGQSAPAPAPPTAASTQQIGTPRLPGESRFRIRRRTSMVLRILFPSLQSFRHKSYLGMFLAIVSVPSILALTVTLPVVDDGGGEEGGVALPEGDDEPLHDAAGSEDDTEERLQSDDEENDADSDRRLRPEIGEELHHLVDNHFSPLHSPLGRITHSAMRRQYEAIEASGEDGLAREANDSEYESQKEIWEGVEEDEALDFNKTLAAVQCLLGPAWCVLVMFQGTTYLRWVMLGAVIAGFLGAVVTIILAKDGTSSTWRLIRCFAGFVCSMVWIAAIADEVVGVLKALGEILGLSDAIVGLTIFAVGNSLADLVANVTVAQFAPAMAYAACFGGPMLNLLLGVGGSGTYHMIAHPHKSPVKINFSPTLWVSASGLVLVLVGTAIFVPLNGYLIDRKWAGCLIVCYTVLMVINVAVEVKTGR